MAFSFGNAAGGEKKTGTLFGSTTAPPGGLFGQAPPPPANTGQPSLFGGAAPTQSNNLFGNTNQQNTGGSGLFGQPQQPPQQNAASGLFGQSQPQQNAGSNLWGQPHQPQQQAPPQAPFNNSLFGSSLQPPPQLNQSQSQSTQQQNGRLPQLRQSSTQPFHTASISGQSL
jgi:nuclear pore complex protein Nup54